MLWEFLPRAGLIPELFLPALSSTLIAGWNEAGEYGHALAVTLYEVAISMVFACGGGILLGAIVGSLPRPRVLIMPMVSSLYAVPLVILYPVFTVWLGIGSESKIAFASIYGFLPTMLSTAAGIQTIDPQLLLAARSMGATLSQRLVRVIIPAAIPTVLSGLRVGGALVIVGVVVSEMLISSAGIGYLISRYRTILDSPHVFAGVLLVLAMAIAFNAAIRMDRAQGRDLADRHPRRPERRGRNRGRRCAAAGDLTPDETTTSKESIVNLPKHLLPTTVVGSYPQPEWLVDRAMLSKSVPRTRMHEMWRLPEEHLEQAQDDATIVAIRDMERAGIDIVTDGEIRRESYSNRFATALEGIDADNPAMITARIGTQDAGAARGRQDQAHRPGRTARHAVPAQEYRPRRQDHPARPLHHEPAGQERILQGRRGAGDGVRRGRQCRGARPAEGRRRRDPARRALGAQQSRSSPGAMR